ncbi:hypothetical protein HK103_000427 [Boothiomyces macroporosus]|uniref:DUF2855 family protein n=1 Tax=Boothiomyces macroporosus TaxID=261099 RepID=A0AAD5UC12_9FUNG|nr:hypothetical protein HK103_000427 [Boothiomyces macroporosus]
MNSELVLKKDFVDQVRIQTQPLPPLAPEHVLIRIEIFGLTANNITYIALGKSLQYFDFFPADSADEAKAPVWGIGVIEQSNSPLLKKGERIYGYYPIAKYISFKPVSIKNNFFYVIRDQLPRDRAVYNQYFRANGDPEYIKNNEELMLLFRPLWTTSFFLHDFLVANGFFDAKKVVISSASSKTGYSFALLLKDNDFEVIGLTSKSNVEFVTSLNFYDKVVRYDDISELPTDEPIVYCDFAGSDSLNRTIHNHFGPKLQKQVVAGMSHVSEANSKFGDDKSITFFAPEWIKVRKPKVGDNIVERREKAWNYFIETIVPHVNLKYVNGAKDVVKVYHKMLKGQSTPDEGYILSMFDSSAKL